MIISAPLSPSQWKTAEQIRREREAFTTDRTRSRYRKLDDYRGKKILLWTRKPGFGDRVMNAICCQILRRTYGLDVWFGVRNDARDRQLAEVVADLPCYEYRPDLRSRPLADHEEPRGYWGGVDYAGDKHPFDFILDFRYRVHAPYNAVFQCLREFGVRQLAAPIDGLAVHRLPETSERYDVVACTNCGGWKPVRGYRRGAELIELLRGRGLRVLHLEADVARSLGTARLLAVVKAAKLWFGVETGPTHVVSGVHRRAIVVQSGIHPAAFWNVYGRTTVVEADWSCGGRQCQVRRHAECNIPEGVCIDRFSPTNLADAIENQLRTAEA